MANNSLKRNETKYSFTKHINEKNRWFAKGTNLRRLITLPFVPQSTGYIQDGGILVSKLPTLKILVAFLVAFFRSLSVDTFPPGARFSKVPRTFGARKAIPKTPSSLFCKSVFFSYIVKGIKIKITARFCDSKCLRFEDTKSIMTAEMRPKSFGTFEKQAPGPEVFNIVQTSRAWGQQFSALFKLSEAGAIIYVQSLLKFSSWGVHGRLKIPPPPTSGMTLIAAF